MMPKKSFNKQVLHVFMVELQNLLHDKVETTYS